MPLTRDFKETIRARVKRDPGFRQALLREGIENFLSGDVETGKIILRDFINATVGFTKLSGATNRSAKSLMRMLGPRGNPQARNLFEIVAYLQHAEGIRFELRPARAALRTKPRSPARGPRTSTGAKAGKHSEFSKMAKRFRNASDPKDAKRLGDKLGRMVFGGQVSAKSKTVVEEAFRRSNEKFRDLYRRLAK
jgi:hypothetical protein